MVYAVICGSRTGSSYYCDLLKSTERLGNPIEYFHTTRILYLMQGNVDDYLDGIIGAKIITDENRQTNLAIELGFFDRVTHWIYLQRKNIKLQAISRYKANALGIWTHGDFEPDIDFNRLAINGYVEEITEQNERDLKFMQGKNYLQMYYEDIIDRPLESVLTTLDFLGVSKDNLPKLKSDKRIGNRKQNLEWEQRLE